MLILFAILIKTFFLFTNPSSPKVVLYSPTEYSTEILFRESGWEKALKESKSSGKPIFLNFHATWCAPCKLMKYRTFTNNELANYLNSNYINLRLDGEEGEGKALMEAFGLRAYPSTLFFGPEGNLIWGKSGYLGPNELLAVAREISN